MDTLYRDIAMSQAETLNEQARRIRELIRERDAARSDREAALDMAEQYARKAGVDISREDLIRGVEDYWRHRRDRESWVSKLETFHWDVLATVREIEDGISQGLVGEEASGLAQRIAHRLRAANPLSRTSRPKGPLFDRPVAPGLSDD